MKLTSALTVALAAAFSTAAQADLIAIDWRTPGDQLLMKDTVTGLEWLRLGFTYGQSFDAVTLRLHTDLVGFDFATAAQADVLFTDAKALGPNGIQTLVNLWGPGHDWHSDLVGVSAITRTVHPDWPNVRWLAEAAYQTDLAAHPDLPYYVGAMNGTIIQNFSSRLVGSGLIRVSGVPEPAAWLQCVVGLGAFVALRRRVSRRALKG